MDKTTQMTAEFNRAELLRIHILEFIKQHPGAIKQELIDYITEKGYGSRKTITRELWVLEVEEKSIKVVKEKPNSQRHHLYINSDSEVRSALYDLTKLKESFFKLIDQLKNVSNWDEDDYEKNESTRRLISRTLLVEDTLWVYASNLSAILPF